MKKDLILSGIIVVNKPKGLTSRDVVNHISKSLSTKKVGHTGTLDPLATGVLICPVGKCTKLTDFLTSTYKTYRATMQLGYETDTLDITGKIIKESSKEVAEEQIKKVINSFQGTYMQEVPKYSAVKINGKKLYEYARSQEKIELPKREVHIQSISNINIDKYVISFDCVVSKGTYIRSLIRDIGIALKTYATMVDLIRIEQGNYNIEDAFSLEEIEKGEFELITPEEILKDIYTIDCNDLLYKDISNGVPQIFNIESEYIFYKYNGKALALYKKNNDKFRMYVMF